jgi:hypothetical protein
MSLLDKIQDPEIQKVMDTILQMESVKSIEPLLNVKEIETVNATYAKVFTSDNKEFILRISEINDMGYEERYKDFIGKNPEHIVKVFYYNEIKKYNRTVTVMEALEPLDKNEMYTISNLRYRILNDFLYEEIEPYVTVRKRFLKFLETNINKSAEGFVSEFVKFVKNYEELLTTSIDEDDKVEPVFVRYFNNGIELSQKNPELVHQMFKGLMEYKEITGALHPDIHRGNVMKKGNVYKLIDL